jgi:hypothetical protein
VVRLPLPSRFLPGSARTGTRAFEGSLKARIRERLAESVG